MKTHLNLIPVKTRNSQEIATILLTWGKITFVIAIICISLAGYDWFSLHRAHSQLSALDKQFEPLDEMLEEQRDAAEQIKHLESREHFTLSLGAGVDGVSLLGVVSQSVAKASGGVYLSRLNFTTKANEVQLAGAGIDGMAVASFAQHLRDAGYFSEVRIGNTRKLPGGAPAMRAFEIECAF